MGWVGLGRGDGGGVKVALVSAGSPSGRIKILINYIALCFSGLCSAVLCSVVFCFVLFRFV